MWRRARPRSWRRAIRRLRRDKAGGLVGRIQLQDVKNFTWGNLFYGFDDKYADAFDRGYESVRPFTADEKRHADLFLLAKTFRLLSGMAHISVAVGRGTLRFRNLDWLGGYIRDKARPLGLL